MGRYKSPRNKKQNIGAAKNLMTAEWKLYWYDRLIGRRHGQFYHSDRTDVPMGYCEKCFEFHELHPFGPGGKWFCFGCTLDDPKAMNEELDKLNKARLIRRDQASKAYTWRYKNAQKNKN